MRNIAVGIKYLSITKNKCIPKAQIKAYDTVDDNNATGLINGFYVAGRL